ncbi:MAG TPA: YraN family protein [Desulfobacterales bacterium]|nr:YraN family protein [Desulfobacterales bacterium]HIP38127.1 YraN family protein [Desulfocapsa sulfexigens]
MSDNRISLGKKGEDLAASFLKKNGFQIIQRNYRQKIGEIDIIARQNEWLVFIEVKARKSIRFGQPFEAVTQNKQAQICRVALDFMTRNKLLDQPVRFDVISILFKGEGGADIEHLPNCFELNAGFY